MSEKSGRKRQDRIPDGYCKVHPIVPVDSYLYIRDLDSTATFAKNLAKVIEDHMAMTKRKFHLPADGVQ